MCFTSTPSFTRLLYSSFASLMSTWKLIACALFSSATFIWTERPMKIEIVVDPSRPPPLSARVTPAPAMNGAQTKYDWFIAYPQSRWGWLRCVIGWLLLLDDLIIQDADELGRVTGRQSQLPIWMLRWRFIPFFCLNAWSSVDIRLVGLYYLECSCCCHHGTRLIPRYVGNQGLNGKSVGFLSRFLSPLCLFPSCPYFVSYIDIDFRDCHTSLPPGRLVSPGVPDLSLESWLSRYSKLIHGCHFLFLEPYQGQYKAKKKMVRGCCGASPQSIIQSYLINK